MQGRQHEVTRQRRLHGDLRGLAVAHFPDHDDVRILAQDRAQGVGEGQPDLRMHLDLVDSLQLVFDRVLDVDDLLGRGIELGQRRIQGGGLARAGRSGHQHDAVRPRQQRVEFRQRVGFEAHLLEAEADAGAIQHAHHHALAVNRRHCGDPQVELAALDPGLDAAVLRQAALGDVEMGQQFHPGAHRGAMLGRHQLGRMDHAVDAVTHMQAVVERLQVDIGRAQLDHLADDGVDEANHRGLAGQVFQVFDKVAGVIESILVFVQPHPRRGLGQGPFDVAGQGDIGLDDEPRRQPQGLQDKLVLWRHHGHIQPTFFQSQRIAGVAAEELGQQARRFDRQRGEIVRRGERHAELDRPRLHHVRFRDKTQLDQHRLQRAAHFEARGDRPLEIAGAQFARPDQQVSQLLG